MAKQFLDVARRTTGGQQTRSLRVAKIVDANVGEPGPLERSTERLANRRRPTLPAAFAWVSTVF